MERDPLRVKNLRKQVTRPWMGSDPATSHVTRVEVVAGLAQWPEPPDLSLPAEVRHPACLPLPSSRPAQGLQPLCVKPSTNPAGLEPVPRSKLWMWKEHGAGILPLAGCVTLGTSLP